MGGTIYAIRSKVDNKRYVGQSNRFKDRKYLHVWKLRHNKHPNAHLQGAWNKHGESNFVFEIMEDGIAEDYIDDKERAYIALYRANNNEYGYNNEFGGKLFRHHSEESKRKIGAPKIGKPRSEETRRKISRGLIGSKNPNWGKHFTDEHKRNMGDSHRGSKHYKWGKHLTKEHKRKIGDAHRGSKNHMWGKHPTEETRRKNSIAHRGCRHPCWGKHPSEETIRKRVETMRLNREKKLALKDGTKVRYGE
jgi:group I intron endonuclease